MAGQLGEVPTTGSSDVGCNEKGLGSVENCPWLPRGGRGESTSNLGRRFPAGGKGVFHQEPGQPCQLPDAGASKGRRKTDQTGNLNPMAQCQECVRRGRMPTAFMQMEAAWYTARKQFDYVRNGCTQAALVRKEAAWHTARKRFD